MIKPEVLAPAGSPESLDNAIRYGADAVYLAGRQFGMRSGAANFDEAQMAEAVAKAHENNVKLYVACNVVARGAELEDIAAYLRYLEQLKPDGIIASDLGVMRLIQKNAPSVPLHISTQTGVANSETANVLYEMGAKRVVLARELSLEEVRMIRRDTPDDLEIEAFVHGSMCVSFSGRCLLSNYFTGRDGNHGECAQPCRWKYYLMEETREGQYFPVFEDERGTYIMNSRDMNMLAHIPELLDCGVTSLKIEGRAKSAYYTAVITNAYRCAVDEYMQHVGEPDYRVSQWILDEADKVSHREYSTGFYYGSAPGQVYRDGGYSRPYTVAAVVEDSDGEWLTLIQRNRFFEGDTLEIFEPKAAPRDLVIECMYNADGERIQAAPHPMMTVRIPSEMRLPKGTILRMKK